MSYSFTISKRAAAEFGITVIFITPVMLIILTFYKKVKKNSKAKKVLNYLKRNKLYFFKVFIILSVFFPRILSIIFNSLHSFFQYLFNFLLTLGNKLVSFDLFFSLGLSFFQILILPLLKLLLFFSDFLVNFRIFNIYVFLNIFLFFYSCFWTTIGFVGALSEKLEIYKSLKIFILRILELIFSTIFLFLHSIMIEPSEGMLLRQKLKKIIRANKSRAFVTGFFNYFSNFFYVSKSLLFSIQQFSINRFLILKTTFNALETYKLKSEFLLFQSINFLYLTSIWYIRLKWMSFLVISLKSLTKKKLIKN